MHYMKQLGVGLLLGSLPIASAEAGHVWYRDRDGATGAYEDATWANLQSAITAAQGGSAGVGAVKISGDITRTDAGSPQLSVAAGGNVTLDGGWNWPGGGAEPTAQSGRSRLDGAYPTATTRVLYITDAPNVTVSRVEILRGYATGNTYGGGIYVSGTSHGFVLSNAFVYSNIFANAEYQRGGGGVGINGSTALTGVRISKCVISNNMATGGSRGDGGGLLLYNTGSDASPAIIEYSTIADNFANGKAGNDVGGGGIYMDKSTVVIANSRIVNNVGNNNATTFMQGDAIFKLDGKLTVFGSLIAGNTNATRFAGSTVYSGTSSKNGNGQHNLVLANCTLAGNATAGTNGTVTAAIFVAYQAFTQQIVAVNSILDAGRFLARYDNKNGYNLRGHLTFQNSTVNASANDGNGGPYRFDDLAGAHNAVSLAGILAMLDVQASPVLNEYRFHSLNTASPPALTQNLEQNIDGTAAFVGAGEHPYALQATNPNALDNGLTRTGDGYTYVDINANGSYNALVDVIVAGTAPAGSHFVYSTDLAGNPRVVGGEIDRGAYEYATVAVKGTAILIR